ncbi:MAG: hypothetical protein M0D54_12015 [Hyphomonadaceae bacterium JAD_PAG50586_4]|nr:MAG: hypothetical protein M0D54_12015 [Hyphomonadaceae bacterium JAD_PAG50586_4]
MRLRSWGPIYLGLALYAVFQALPRTPNHESLERFGWPSVVAMTGCGLWLIAAAHDMQWATVLIIVASAGALTAPLLKRPAQPTPSAFWLIEAPLALLAGWLTIASAINLLTVLTAEGFIENALLWAAIGIVAVAAITGLIGWRSLAPFYLPPVVWGLIGVAVAEAARKPQISWLALGAALALAGLAAAVVHRRQALR